MPKRIGEPRLRGSATERKGGVPSRCYICEDLPTGADMFKIVRKPVGFSGYGTIEETFCSKCWGDVKMLIDKVKAKERMNAK